MRPGTSWGTYQEYCQPLPSMKWRPENGSKSSIQAPAESRGTMYFRSGWKRFFQLSDRARRSR